MSGMERKLIHIVEDDVAVSRLIEGTLQRFNYRSAVFRTGAEFAPAQGRGARPLHPRSGSARHGRDGTAVPDQGTPSFWPADRDRPSGYVRPGDGPRTRRG